MPKNPISGNQPQRVFITGMGMISPMGHGFVDHVDAMRAGSTHFSPVDLFDTSKMRTQTAGMVEMPAPATGGISEKHWNRLDRGGRLLYFSTKDAIDNAGINGIPDNTLFAVGTSAASMPIGEDYYKTATDASASRKGQFVRVEQYQAQSSLNLIQRGLGMRNRTQVISNACASGANAIGHAFHEIRAGRSSIALAAGYDAMSELVFGGFNALQALCESGIPRPFDANRDGLALGEGAASFVLESEESMKQRGAKPLAEVRGYGMATDLHHLTQPHQEGDAAVASMTAACQQAELQPTDIQYINSHGTGTPLNDSAEARAICRWASEDAQRVMVSSTKSAIGHLLGGAGAVESALCLLAMKEQLVPASLNIRDVDPACQFDVVREPRPFPLRRVLTNSFGFGGCNATLIFSH